MGHPKNDPYTPKNPFFDPKNASIESITRENTRGHLQIPLGTKYKLGATFQLHPSISYPSESYFPVIFRTSSALTPLSVISIFLGEYDENRKNKQHLQRDYVCFIIPNHFLPLTTSPTILSSSQLAFSAFFSLDPTFRNLNFS